MKEQVVRLFEDQLSRWPQARENYNALEQAQIKTFDIDGHIYKAQFNPSRIMSSSAQIDAQSLRARKCFLCAEHHPPEQDGIPFQSSNGQYKYTLLVNPYPIFPRHLTIPSVEHTPQRINERFEDMIDLAQLLDDYVIFYNGPTSGASAPDHFHFQAGSKGFLPIENDVERPRVVRIVSRDRTSIVDSFYYLYTNMKKETTDDEPKMNLLTWYDDGAWTVLLFPRKKHRPACYAAEGDANLLISPGAVDIGGVFITPLEKDFLKITATDIAAIIDEVLISG